MEREVTPPVAGQERAAVGRGQNSVLTQEHDAAAIRRLLGMVLDRVDAEAHEAIQGVVLAADIETVMEIGRAAAVLDRPAGVSMLAVPSAKRGARAIRSTIPTVVITTPADLLSLVRESLAKLQSVRVAVFAWAEDLLADEETLSTLVAELPKDAARILVASRLTSDVESFAERHVRRIARAAPAAGEALRAPISFVHVSENGKPAALRRVLDSLDPATAVVFARSDDGARAARTELAAMGMAAEGIRVTQEPLSERGEVLILYELPATPAELRAHAGDPPVRIVALTRSRDLPALRALSTGTLRPLAVSGPVERAHAREEAMRDALRAVLDGGVPSREVLALEPLLEEYDGLEIAAAALRLLERSPAPRTAAAAPLTTGIAPAEPAPRPQGTVRVFFGVGSRDGAAARDLVGAIANVGGIPADRIGKVEVRESHSLVELQAGDAESVVEKLAGATIRGRRIVARVDRERSGARGERSRDDGAPRGRSDRPRGDRPRGDRPRDDRPRGDRPRDTRPRGAARDRSSAGPRQRDSKGSYGTRERGAPQRRDRGAGGKGRRSD